MVCSWQARISATVSYSSFKEPREHDLMYLGGYLSSVSVTGPCEAPFIQIDEVIGPVYI